MPIRDMASTREKWLENLEKEEGGDSFELVGFRRYLEEKKGDEFRFRMDPNSPLQSLIKDVVDAPPGATVRLLDVGAGPLTCLGKVWADRTVEVTPVDPLADHYKRILGECGLTPPVFTQKADAERLTEAVPQQYFDLACSRNALDHSYDPFEAIREMLKAIKPDGSVLIQHYVNEGISGGYIGLHQWNFCLHRGDFVIWNKSGHMNVTRSLANTAEVVRAEILPNAHPDYGDWLVVVMRHRGSSKRGGSRGDWKLGKTAHGEVLQVL
jgi:SAM-dependent methyltransferase